MRAHQGWNGFRSVLCPVDFSATSKRALKYAAAVATRSAGGRLIVVYVADRLVVAAAESRLHDTHFLQRSRRELARFVQGALRTSGLPRARVSVEVSAGEAADHILKAARGADLIVMGTHGVTGPRRLVTGSTTRAVLQRTSTPVLAIPPAPHGRAPHPSIRAGKTVVAAVDLDARARRAVRAAARVAAWLPASLVLVHVVDSSGGPRWMSGALAADRRIRLARAQNEVDRLAAYGRRFARTEGRVLCGHPDEEIAALVAATKPDLLITTLSEPRGWFGPRRGALSYHVLSHATVPVLACPRDWLP